MTTDGVYNNGVYSSMRFGARITWSYDARNRRSVTGANCLIKLISVSRPGGRVDRVAVTGADREVIDQSLILRNWDTNLDKPFVDRHALVDGDGDTPPGQGTGKLHGVGREVECLGAMLEPRVHSDALMRQRGA